MNQQTWIDPRVDRSDWGRGEWDGEPDKVQWTDEATGLVCLAKRTPCLGHWCGYVGVQPAHKFHGKDYGASLGECNENCGEDYHFGHRIDSRIDVHGGLTFSSGCTEGPIEQTICHLPAPGEPDHLWWFGFDCAHLNDTSPGRMRNSFFDGSGDYRTLRYVQAECAKLAHQLKAVA